MTGNIHQSKKIKIWIKDKLTCTYCSKKSSNKITITIDHVLPQHLGGTNEYRNLTTACHRCNTKKKDMLLTQFIKKFEIKITPKIARFL